MSDTPKYVFTEPGQMGIRAFDPKSMAITFCSGGGEMLRIANDGFYVRGVKLEQDEKEAKSVYNAMIAWLVSHGMM